MVQGGAALSYGQGTPVHDNNIERHGASSRPSPHTTQGPSWGYLKVNFSETLSIFGDKRPQNGSQNGEMALRTGTGCPHIGPFVDGLRTHLAESDKVVLQESIPARIRQPIPYISNVNIRLTDLCGN